MKFKIVLLGLLFWTAFNSVVNHSALACVFRERNDLLGLGGRVPTIGERLVQSAKIGNADRVASLIMEGADLETRDTQNDTALTWAAYGGHTKVVEVLLGNGAKVDNPDGVGKTALMWAARHGHLQILELLLSHQADKNAVDRDGNTVLHGVNSITSLLPLLKEPKPNVNAVNALGDTPLLQAVRSNQVDLAKALVAAGANLNLANGSGYTPIMLALQILSEEMRDNKVRDYNVFEFLRGAGADLNQMSHDGQTPLTLAAATKNLGLVESMLKVNQIWDPETLKTAKRSAAKNDSFAIICALCNAESKHRVEHLEDGLAVPSMDSPVCPPLQKLVDSYVAD